MCTIPAACGPGWPPRNVTQYHEVINLIAQCPIFGAVRDPSVPAASIWSLALCAPLTEEPSDGDTHHSSPTLADRSWNRRFGVGDISIWHFLSNQSSLILVLYDVLLGFWEGLHQVLGVAVGCLENPPCPSPQLISSSSRFKLARFLANKLVYSVYKSGA